MIAVLLNSATLVASSPLGPLVKCRNDVWENQTSLLYFGAGRPNHGLVLVRLLLDLLGLASRRFENYLQEVVCLPATHGAKTSPFHLTLSPPTARIGFSNTFQAET